MVGSNMKRTIKVKSKKELISLIKSTIEKEGPNCDLNFIDVSHLRDFSYVFFENRNFNGDISDWDVSNARTMKGMFMRSGFAGDISKWDVSKVKNMKSMFYASMFNGDLSKWNVSSVVNMACMFQSAHCFNNNSIACWNTSKVRSMYMMFRCCLKYDPPLSSWDVSNVINMHGMFDECYITHDLSKWNVSNVINMSYMFWNSTYNGSLSAWNVSRVRYMGHMFEASSFKGDISTWDVSSVRIMNGMFQGTSFNGDISKWDVSNVIQMEKMFSCSKFNGDLSSWNVKRVRNMRGMFAKSEFTGDISRWDVSSVKNMADMFYCSKFSGDLSSWNVGRVYTMEGMFAKSSFNGDIAHWDVSKVKNMSYMFFASPFDQDLSDWKPWHLRNMHGMFAYSNFSHSISSWRLSGIKKKCLFMCKRRKNISFEETNSQLSTEDYFYKQYPSAVISGKTAPKKDDCYWYFRPSIGLLKQFRSTVQNNSGEIKNTLRSLNDFLKKLNTNALVTDYLSGPVITRFDIYSEKGVDNISLIIRAHLAELQKIIKTGSIMMRSAPQYNLLFLEIPNRERRTLNLGKAANRDFLNSEIYLPFYLGVDTAGDPVKNDLVKFSLVQIIGNSKSGITTLLNTMLATMLLARSPSELRLILSDLKTESFLRYKELPHLLTPVITSAEKTTATLSWLIREMEDRYKIIRKFGVLNIHQFNRIIRKKMQDYECDYTYYDPDWIADKNRGSTPFVVKPVPCIVMVIDGLDKLLASEEISKLDFDPLDLIRQIVAKGRDAGIHLVLSSCSSTAGTIPVFLRSDTELSIAFKLKSSEESCSLLDESGAENLLEYGDMLVRFHRYTQSKLMRIHGFYTSQDEICALVKSWAEKAGKPEYAEGITDFTDVERIINYFSDWE